MSEKKVKIEKLSNGLQVIIFSHGTVPKVSTQLWYRVGSRHESSQQRGIAHLLEHMTFKGTDRYAESDIDYITSYYAGYCNAFTSFDYTAYQFDFPQNAWEVSLGILSECMSKCQFKEDLLNSERVAVIQELRMYQDDYESLLLEKMTEMIFAPHPYAYPVIGYKSDIWNMNRANLSEFYSRYYQPHNATLFIGGAVDPERAFEKVVAAFGSIPANQGSAPKNQLFEKTEIIQHSVILQREISTPIGMVAWIVPGLSSKLGFVLDCLLWLLVADKGSLLHKEFVEKRKLVTELTGFNYDLFDQGLLAIQYTPADDIAPEQINEQIAQYMKIFIASPLNEELVAMAYKKGQLAHAATDESIARTVSIVGELYQATGDIEYAFNYNKAPIEYVTSELQQILHTYIRPEYMHTGAVVPMAKSEKKKWQSRLRKENESDALARKKYERNTELESRQHHSLPDVVPPTIAMPDYQVIECSNGLRIIVCPQQNTDKCEVILKLKADNQYDPDGLEGIAYCVSQMILEGTHEWPGQSLIEEFDRSGMHVASMPGVISITCWKEDVKKALELLNSMITHAEFSSDAFERIINRMHTEIDIFWDEPSEFIVDFARSTLYKDHPYSKLILGSHETVGKITLTKIKEWYDAYYSPSHAHLVVVGANASGLTKQAQTLFERWQERSISDLDLSHLKPISSLTAINYPICRDQIAVCFACRTVARMDPDYYTLLLFEQLFTGGFLGSLHSRLFQLRERTGLFYSINASLAAYADNAPGMAYIMTLLSPDRLQEGLDLLKQTIQTATDNWTEQDLHIARNAVRSGVIDACESQQGIAGIVLFLDRYNLSRSYFQEQLDNLNSITLADIKRVVQKYLKLDRMLLITAGLCDE